MSPDRRDFLKAAAALPVVAAVQGCVPDTPLRTEAGRAAILSRETLEAVASVVLPSELGDSGRREAVEAFRGWVAAYRPGAELNHGYGTSVIRHAPADPLPRWTAQLGALEAECARRHGVRLSEVEPRRRDALVREVVAGAGSGVPDPRAAEHVAVALLAYWLERPEATDLCYGAAIRTQNCRGIHTAPDQPESRT